MAKIQFGGSSAQIEGSQVPVIDLSLAAGEGVYFSHDKILWRDGKVNLSNMSGNLFKRMRAGMPIMMMQAIGPGRIAFSHDLPGEVVAIPLNPGGQIMTREHHMLLATHSVAFDGRAAWTSYTTGSGNDSETHYPLGMYVDEFKASTQPGLVLLHAAGNVFTKHLNEGEFVDVSPHSVLAWHCHIQLRIELANSISQRSYLSLRATGPGRVWIQSGTHGRTEEWRSTYNYHNAVIC